MRTVLRESVALIISPLSEAFRASAGQRECPVLLLAPLAECRLARNTLHLQVAKKQAAVAEQTNFHFGGFFFLASLALSFSG